MPMLLYSILPVKGQNPLKITPVCERLGKVFERVQHIQGV